MTYFMYEEEGGGFSGTGRTIDDNELSLREVFGPEDWDSSEVRGWDDPWPKRADITLGDPNHPKNLGRR